MKKIAVIGGGIIGLSSAYNLLAKGHQVTVFDESDLQTNCSVGNAGMIVPSHIVPLAAPGMITKGIKWMLHAKSPFYVRPRLNKELISWGLKFYRASTQEHVEKSIPVLKEISQLSRQLYQQWNAEKLFDFGFQERGLLMLYQTRETEKEEAEAAHLANKVGIEAHVLSLAEIQRMEPHIQVAARGGVYFPGDAHVNPNLLMRNLYQYLLAKGVLIHKNTRIDDFVIGKKHVEALRVKNETHVFDEYILTAGAWSGLLAKKLGIQLPMQGGKGYSFNLTNMSNAIQTPTLLLEGRVAVTPMGNSVRIGGTMEINGTDRSINLNRVQGIVETIPKYYPEWKVEIPDRKEIWSGLRPCSPDGLPYIGRSKTFDNLIIATGHSMMGLSLGPATGLLVTQLVEGTITSMDLEAFQPDRF